MRLLPWGSQSLFLVLSALGVLSLDIFVDDAYPNIIYSPSNQWVQGATCGTSCAIQPDAPSVHDGTWHYATYDPTQDSTPPSIAYAFKATSILVRNILPPLVTTAPTSHVELTFELDGGDPVPYSYSPAGDAVFSYGEVVFSSNNLAYGDHTLVIRVPPGQASVVLFDCFELTVPDGTSQDSALPPPSPSSSSSSTSASLAAAPPTPTATVTQLSQSPSAPASPPARSSPTSSPSTSSSSPIASPASAVPSGAHVSSSGDSQASGNTSSAGITSTPTSDTPTEIASTSTATASSGAAAPQSPQSPSASSTDSSSVRNAAIGGAVGGGVLVIVLFASFCLFRIKRARKRRASVGGESPSPDGVAAIYPIGDRTPMEQSGHHEPSLAALAHRPRPQGYAENPFLDDAISSFAPFRYVATPGDSEGNASDPSADASVSHVFPIVLPTRTHEPPQRRPASLHRWNIDEKSSSSNSSSTPTDARAVPVSPDFASTTSLLPTETDAQHIVGAPTPRLAGQLAAELAALREEVAQIRQHREEATLLEAPPQYDDA